MLQKPKVSYICSAKNEESQIARCARSVLRQEDVDIELILVDDHSSDKTWEIIQSLAASDNRVRGVKNQGMTGLTYSLNIGLDFAKGEYIARIDCDDFAHIDRTRKQVELLDANPEAAMCATSYRVVDPGDWELYCHGPSSDPQLLRWSLCFRNNIRHSTVMWRRSLDVRYEPAFLYAQDYELWCRISRLGNILVIGEVLTTIRNWPESITSTKHEEQELMADRVTVDQYEYYTGAKITQKQGRYLRMVHHLKSPEQFKVFNAIPPADFEEAVERYCRIAESFFKRELPDQERFLADVEVDISSLMNNPEKSKECVRAVRKISRLFGKSSIAGLMEKKVIRTLAKVH